MGDYNPLKVDTRSYTKRVLKKTFSDNIKTLQHSNFILEKTNLKIKIDVFVP